MKQTTAVEWLFNELDNILELYPSEWEEVSKVVKQANAMFEEQIKLAFTQGELFSGDFYDPNNPKIDCSENYYNETYNQ